MADALLRFSSAMTRLLLVLLLSRDLPTCRAATLVPMEAAPVLTSPVFSLATAVDGKTNMNMLTYATPVGIRPQRLWAISLFRKTATHAAWSAGGGRGVLQQLAEQHAVLTHVLGATSGADADKEAACEACGFGWSESAGDGGDERLLPGCVAYLRLVQQGELIDAGEHDVAICAVEGMYSAAAGSRGGGGVVVVTGDEPEPEPLSTALLRERGLISTVGRATDDAADLFRGTAALVSGTIPLDL